jgi:hypothetical protein
VNDIVDMSQFVEAKSDQLNADDLIGTTRTITVRRVTGNDGDQPVSIYYEGDNNKPFKPCKTMRRVLLGVWGRNGADYVGRSMTLYRDDRVTFGGLDVGGIRISHMSHIDKETVVVVMKTKGKKAGIKIKPLGTVDQQEDAQAKWAADFTVKVKACLDLDALEKLVGKQQKWIGILQGERPELHAEVDHAISVARDGLKEGPSDEQRGEPNDDFGEED